MSVAAPVFGDILSEQDGMMGTGVKSEQGFRGDAVEINHRRGDREAVPTQHPS